jgi:hypothetical protein
MDMHDFFLLGRDWIDFGEVVRVGITFQLLEQLRDIANCLYQLQFYVTFVILNPNHLF